MSPDTGVGDEGSGGVETGVGVTCVGRDSWEDRHASCPTRLGVTDAVEAVTAVASLPTGDSTYNWVSESGETIIGGGFASAEGAAFPSLGVRGASGLFWFSNSASDFNRIGGIRESPSGDTLSND